MMKKPIILFILLATISLQANAGWFGPSTYDECVMDKIKGVHSDLAVRLIVMSCRKQFPDKSPPNKNFPLPELPASPAAPAPSSTR